MRRPVQREPGMEPASGMRVRDGVRRGTDPRICLSNLPDEETAHRVARALVEEGIAACVNVLAPCRSVYRWQGRVEEAMEWPVLVKTSSACWAMLVERLRTLHPYDVPEIIELAVVEVDEAYARWVAEVAGPVRAPG